MQSLLYKTEYAINEHIRVMIPTIGEILEQEEAYYAMISVLTATPYDFMVQLDDMGIDFTTINDYDLFLLVFHILKDRDTSLILGSLDLSTFKPMIHPQNQNVVLRNPDGIIIDRLIHHEICSVIRKIHHIKRHRGKPANEAAKKYLIQRARIKLRRKKREETSQLERLIISLVNTEQFPYDFESIKNLTAYQFNASLHQVIRKINYDHRMHGIYAGTIDPKNLSQDDLDWLSPITEGRK